MPLKGPLLALGLAAVASATASAPHHMAPRPAGDPAAWSETKWPFLMDQWGKGRAFRCGAADCGAELNVYVRPKIGFCNCTTGVSDDAELDRVGDVELIGTNYKPLAAGHAVTAGTMSGRARLFTVERPLQPAKIILTIALANKCDAIVATIATETGTQTVQEANALDFLRSARVQHWAEAQHSRE